MFKKRPELEPGEQPKGFEIKRLDCVDEPFEDSGNQRHGSAGNTGNNVGCADEGSFCNIRGNAKHG
jgi:hypothetical protein